MCSSQREERRITLGPEGAPIITDVRPLSSLARYKISQHRVSQHRIGHERWLYRSNHQDLIALRTEQGMHTEVPDLTSWAQVNGRNELPIL
jgi:hypothetical protein